MKRFIRSFVWEEEYLFGKVESSPRMFGPYTRNSAFIVVNEK